MVFSNGIFLVISRIGMLWEEFGFKVWVYNVDGIFKEEKFFEVFSVYMMEVNVIYFD